MKTLTSKKAIICFFSVGTIVLAGTIKDFHTRTVQIENTETVESDIIPVERNLASEISASSVAQMNLPVNSENSQKVNTTWEITRIVGSDELVTYDKNTNPEDAKKLMKVEMELIGNGIVKLDKSNEQVYRVSLISDMGTIALFKKLGDGYEIIEAKKVVVTKEENTALVVDEEVELVLERAVNQSKSNEILEGQDAVGQVSLSSKAINNLSVDLKNSNGEIQNIQIDNAKLLDGGTFTAEVNGEEVSGVVFNNGNEGYRISFVTGPIAGSMLNFVSKEQMQKNQDAEQETKDQTIEANAENTQQPVEEQKQNAVTEEAQQAQDASVNERKEVANEETPAVLSADEVKETAESKGFAF